MPHFAKRLLLILAAGSAISAAPAPRYVIDRAIAGPDGGWDYVQVDPETHRVYVAHGDVVTEIDPLHGDAVRSFGAIMKAHAVVPIPGGTTLLVTSGRDDSVRLLDLRDGSERAKIAVGGDPDAAFYDAASQRAVVMNAKAGTVSLIDVATAKVTGTIVLKPGLEFGVLGADDTLYVNNEDESEIETANLATGKAGRAIALPGCTSPTGLGFDAKTGHLLSACANGKAALVNTKTGKLASLIPIGLGPDAVIMDTARRLAFIPCGKDGVLSAVALDSAVGHSVSTTFKTEIGARTGALDPSSGVMYLPAARFAPPTVAGGRPVPIKGSFHIMVIKRE
ncbi:YncE family protein [Sphingomonas sp. MMS24-J45]|uniref:YncE family protein n=1 Tax=Sphingomonas sp. MMS24-J45 TaxID=3238806 RepID=UPI00384A6329